MADPTSERVTCPACGKGYRWQDTLVGRTVPCKQCDESFIVPDAPGVGLPLAIEPDNNDSVYALDLGEEVQPDPPAADRVVTHNGNCPSCNSPIKASAVLCLNCGFNMREGKKMQTAVVKDPVQAAAELPPEQTKDALQTTDPEALARHRRTELIYPLVLVGIGVFFALLTAFIIAPFNPNASANASAVWVAIGILIYASLIALGVLAGVVIGMAILLSTYGSSFGDLQTAALKIVSISLATAAITICFTMLYENWAAAEGISTASRGAGRLRGLIRFIATYTVCFSSVMVLFDLDKIEANVITLAVVVLSFGVAMLGPAVLAAFF